MFKYLLVFLLLFEVNVCLGHEHMPNIVSFFVSPSESERKVVLKSAVHPSVQCKFRFSTASTVRNAVKTPPSKIKVANEQKEKEEDASQSEKFDFDKAVALLRQRAVCPSMRVDYWDYEICLTGKARQFHQTDEYILANDVKVDSDKRQLLLTNGQPCAAAGGTRRSVRVNFACAPGENNPALASISEPAPCVYEALIAHSEFCKDQSFERVAISAGMNTFHAQAVALSFEDWTLEMHHQDQHSLSGSHHNASVITYCQAYLTDSSSHASLYFHSATLSIVQPHSQSPNPPKQKNCHGGVARGSDRQVVNSHSFQSHVEELSDSELQKFSFGLKEVGEDADDHFNGRLTFLQVCA